MSVNNLKVIRNLEKGDVIKYSKFSRGSSKFISTFLGFYSIEEGKICGTIENIYGCDGLFFKSLLEKNIQIYRWKESKLIKNKEFSRKELIDLISSLSLGDIIRYSSKESSDSSMFIFNSFKKGDSLISGKVLRAKPNNFESFSFFYKSDFKICKWSN